MTKDKTTTDSSRRQHVLDDLDITGDELHRIQGAFKNDEFKRLFGEYMQEIADPANRQLYEQELTQLELERGIRMQFVRPEPGYVLQTIADGRHKTFVNVAQCDLIGRPSSECDRDGDSGQVGLRWQLPYAQAPVHRDYEDEKDGSGGLCQVYDVIFHPDTLHLAAKNERFKELVTRTALEAVRDAFDVQLDMVNVRLVAGVGFKGPVRPTVIRTKIKTASAPEASPLDKIYPPVSTADNARPKKKTANANPKSADVERDAYTTPTHRLVHRKHVDYADMTHELDAKVGATVPDELVLTVELPLLDRVADVQLDVTGDSVFVCSERPARYRLSVKLPYRVLDERAVARFCKDTRRLVVTLPVVKRAPTVDEICAVGVGAALVEEIADQTDLGEVMKDGDSKVVLSEIVEKCTNSNTKKPNNSKPEPSSAPSTAPGAFLDPSIRYSLPPFDCQHAGTSLFFMLAVRNVDVSAAVAVDRCTPHSVHVRFQTLGAGYFPQHYAFFVRLPLAIRNVQPDIWDNEVVLRIDLDDSGADAAERSVHYEAGLDASAVQRYDCDGADVFEDAVEHHDDEGAFGMGALVQTLSADVSRQASPQKLKQRSYSESNCDDFKDDHDHHDDDHHDEDDDDDDDYDDSHADPTKQPSPQKSRTYSECSVDSGPHGLKGILKRRSSSVLSEAASSVDDPHGVASGMALGAGRSIPEEMASSLSKKSVRFDNNIRKLLFKFNSTVAGQRKPKANRRKKKKRSTDRRYSEGEASDYDAKEEEEKAATSAAVAAQAAAGDAIKSSPKKAMHDSGVDLHEGEPANGQQRAKCDLNFKSNMIFELDM